ncbi:MAG: mechanosensitive ion channel protein, partial [Pseudomonadota bacterium]
MTAPTPTVDTENSDTPLDNASAIDETENAATSEAQELEDTEPAPSPEAEAEAEAQEPVEVVEGSNELIEGAEAQSETAGAFLRYMHDAAFEIGNFRFSLLDGLLIIGVILLVVTAAWFVTRLSRFGIRRIARFDGSQQVLAEKLSTILIWGLAFFIGIDMLGIDLTALAFAGGAFGLPKVFCRPKPIA